MGPSRHETSKANPANESPGVRLNGFDVSDAKRRRSESGRVQDQQQDKRYCDQPNGPNPPQNQIRNAQRIRGASLVLGHASRPLPFAFIPPSRRRTAIPRSLSADDAATGCVPTRWYGGSLGLSIRREGAFPGRGIGRRHRLTPTDATPAPLSSRLTLGPLLASLAAIALHAATRRATPAGRPVP
jgi:hypothetical protein